MNVEEINFGIGVVVSICAALIVGMGVWFGMKNQVNKQTFRIDELRKDLEKLECDSKESVDSLDKRVTEALDGLKQEVNGVKEDIGGVKRDVGKVEQGIAEIKGMLTHYFTGSKK